ncbi:hypothetical protein J6590_098428 [Homalodisca vitripennis]|nr:hypothetical protein J6590_098428 [Homalodisca vitripennis]
MPLKTISRSDAKVDNLNQEKLPGSVANSRRIAQLDALLRLHPELNFYMLTNLMLEISRRQTDDREEEFTILRQT